MAQAPPEVIAIVGLTGTGKTELAAELARRLNGEVISCDSMQVYRELDIGTAKPSLALRAEVPHHMIDVLDPDEQMTAGLFAERARAAARDIAARGRAIVLCGGTGLYARAFAGGLAPELASDATVRAELQARSLPELAAELERLDPESARDIAPNDRIRIERALEAARLCGEPTSRVRARHGFADRPFRMRWFGLDLDRGVLWQRIEARVDRMLEAGWLEELERVRTAHGASIRPLQAIGYAELSRVLDGEWSLSQARERIVVQTRRYAKRQRTWFRAESDLAWLDAEQPAAALECVLASRGR